MGKKTQEMKQYSDMYHKRLNNKLCGREQPRIAIHLKTTLQIKMARTGPLHHLRWISA
jgi:hypothetical protein